MATSGDIVSSGDTLVSLCEIVYDLAHILVNGQIMSKSGADEHTGASLRAPSDGRGSQAVQAVGVALEIVEILANGSQALGVSELARRLGHTKARVHRHLATLRELGFVEQDSASDRYRPGWRLFRLGMSLAENFDLRQVARRHLLRLHDEIGQTVVLAMPAGLDITIVDAVQSSSDVAITVRPGSIIPAASSAMGRTILAFQPEPEAAAALTSPVTPLTAETVRDRREIYDRLSMVRERRYELAANQRLAGVTALAAPIFDDRNRVAGSIGILAPHGVLTDPPPLELLVPLQRAVAAVSAELRSTAWLNFRFACASKRNINEETNEISSNLQPT